MPNSYPNVHNINETICHSIILLKPNKNCSILSAKLIFLFLTKCESLSRLKVVNYQKCINTKNTMTIIGAVRQKKLNIPSFLMILAKKIT